NPTISRTRSAIIRLGAESGSGKGGSACRAADRSSVSGTCMDVTLSTVPLTRHCFGRPARIDAGSVHRPACRQRGPIRLLAVATWSDVKGPLITIRLLRIPEPQDCGRPQANAASRRLGIDSSNPLSEGRCRRLELTTTALEEKRSMG